MRYLSLFSGIEAASVAWVPLGWECVAVAEVDPFACAVLKHRFPTVPNLGDVRSIDESAVRSLGNIDLVVFGFPCQDLSVAGKREGLRKNGKATRSGLFFEASRIIRLAAKYGGCRWFVAENVPGLFSSSDGSDFAAVLGELCGLDVRVPNGGWQNAGACGDIRSNEWGAAWGVLDAQHFGIPQRRRRIFIVGYLGDWRCAAAVLFDRESVCGDPPPSRRAGQIASALTANGVGGRGGPDDNSAQGNHLVAATLHASRHSYGIEDTFVAQTLRARDGSRGVDSDCTDTLIAHTLRGEGFDASEDGTGRGIPIIPFAMRGREEGAVPEVHRDGSTISTLRAASGGSTRDMIAFACEDDGRDVSEIAPILRAMGHSGSHANAGGQLAVARRGFVRRLLPVECERLQGFPDDWTLVPYRGRMAEDGPRYRGLGNSMAAPVMHWLGERITLVEKIIAEMPNEIKAA